MKMTGWLRWTTNYTCGCLAYIGLLAGVASAQDLPFGLVAYWPFEENLEDAWSNLDGEERGLDPVGYETGQFGNGLLLDGTDQYVEVVGGDADELDFVGSPMSVSTWFRVDVFDTDWQALIAKGENDGWRIHRRGSEFGMAFTAGEPDTPTSLFDVDDGELHHLVAVSAPNEPSGNGVKRLYIDGELAAEDTRDSIGLPGTNRRVRIGDNPSTNNREWAGLIDDVAIWARDLTDDEVALLWNGGSGTSVASQIQGLTSVGARYVAGAGRIGANTIRGTVENEVVGPGGDVQPGLLQEWVRQSNPGNRDAIIDLVENEALIVQPFHSSDGTSWWTGNQTPGWDVPQYPAEVVDELDNDTNNENYVVRGTGEIFIPESGTYRFSDGIDDYTFWAIDADKSGEAGDDFDEVIIDDNAWTNLARVENSGGEGLGELDIDVAQGGEWLAVEFLMGEGTGTDAGVIYWDYDVNGGGLNAAVDFPEFDTDPVFDLAEAENWLIPDTHLRAPGGEELISADIIGQLSSTKPLELDVDASSKTNDKIVMNNRDPNVFTTILNLDGITFNINPVGAVSDGDTFKIIEADQINGTPTITSTDPTQTWVFNPATGEVTLGGAALPQLQAGDADMDLDFDQLDLVQVQIAARYLTGQAANWGEGDWDGAPGGSPGNPPAGNGFFDQLDVVAALSGGKYLTGPYASLAGKGTEGDEQTSLVYDANTGELRVDSPASKDLTSINITSAGSKFIGDKPAVLDGAFDNFAADNIFKATFGGSFGDISFGNVLPAGISEADVTADLTAVGSLAGGGDLGAVDLVYIPEPATAVLLLVALLACAGRRSRVK